MLDLIIKNGSCYIDKDLKDQDIAIKDGKIIKIGKIDSEAKVKFLMQRFNSFTRMYRYTNYILESLDQQILKILHSGSRAAIVGRNNKCI